MSHLKSHVVNPASQMTANLKASQMNNPANHMTVNQALIGQWSQRTNQMIGHMMVDAGIGGNFRKRDTINRKSGPNGFQELELPLKWEKLKCNPFHLI